MLVRGLARSVFALLVVPAILCGRSLPAQTVAPQSTIPERQQQAAAKSAQPHRLTAAPAHAVLIEPQTAPDAAPPPAAPAPVWPANQPPNQAKVSWDSSGLEIEASNSSLGEILQQAAADTGAKFEGVTDNQRIFDQRIFGIYGPGPARDVLSKLLDGSGYNVLMIGGRDAGAPLEVVLTVNSPPTPQTAASNQNRSNPADDDAADPPEPEQPPPPQMKTPFGNGDSGSPETQQQIMQDILNRQQKIDQQQQHQQNNPQQ